MQSGTIDTLPSGGYRARLSGEGGKRVTRTFRTKTAAKVWLQEAIVSQGRGELPDQTRSGRTFAEYSEVWLATRLHVRASTLAHDRAMLKHALAALGSVPVAKITKGHIQNLVGSLSETHSASTVKHVHRVAAGVLDAAVDDRAVPRNVARGVKLPKEEHSEFILLSAAEVAGIAAAVPERYSALIRLAAASGLRFGELAGLRVDDLKMLERKLTVKRQRLRNGRKPGAAGSVTVFCDRCETGPGHFGLRAPGSTFPGHLGASTIIDFGWVNEPGESRHSDQTQSILHRTHPPQLSLSILTARTDTRRAHAPRAHPPQKDTRTCNKLLDVYM